jgi:hypothetical protein
MLYWAEGSRRKNGVVFTNSDPAMVRYFADFLRSYYSVANEEFRVNCNLFADHVERRVRSSSSGSTRLECRGRASGSRP